MSRVFNIAGPCDPMKHYMIDALRNLGDEIFGIIKRGEYFVIHAARQSGKTTLLLELARLINEEGKYRAVYCSLENTQAAPEVADGIPSVINAIQDALEGYGLPNWEAFTDNVNMAAPFNSLQKALTRYCRSLDKPLVLFFDESDCLSGRTLISFLRQLRNGYANRRNIPFVHSLALVGMRNIRDYRDEYRDPSQTLGSGSPFNIAASTMTLRNFTQAEIRELYGQYTAETGRIFEQAAEDLVWEQTQGQPWLVNAIAREIVLNKENLLSSIHTDQVSAAIQIIVRRRDAHVDSLMARLHEDRVRSVIEPVIIGKEAAIDYFSDDYSYVKDIGLIRDDHGKAEPANPIYAEIIIRSLNWSVQREIEQASIEYQIPRYLSKDIIDIDYLLRDFQVFWRENSDIWQKKFDYQEAAPQLVMQAFLQRVLNGGGDIIREMAAGTGRADICVIYLNKKYPIEMKIRYNDKTHDEGINQILRYMDTLGCNMGWLVIFDRRDSSGWDEKLFCRREYIFGKTVTVYGC